MTRPITSKEKYEKSYLVAFTWNIGDKSDTVSVPAFCETPQEAINLTWEDFLFQACDPLTKRLRIDGGYEISNSEVEVSITVKEVIVFFDSKNMLYLPANMVLRDNDLT